MDLNSLSVVVEEKVGRTLHVPSLRKNKLILSCEGHSKSWKNESVFKIPERRKLPSTATRTSSIHLKLQKHRELAKKALKKKGMTGGPVLHQPKSGSKRLVKFNKGYSALKQNPDESLVSLESDSDGEFESKYYSSSGYSSAEQVNQDLNRQLLKDGYHLDEIPDDEDLDLIPPKPVTSSACSCCQAESSCTVQ
ncbi:protein FAM219B isoform X2 [Scyliorhinus canicula]|uniref:protein FAM219B isoform X2 n=1 Tax=Scyliorhinus canicula TaxID=7830 RepID=UPI0018F55D3C|nr:protein FAM219B isoform X2 [Scyliorhinus canicula]